ncbi:glycosyltransferase [Stella sp.]|uniref:glycosyltransferase n=1 Tax=Stella sp. TaxID=2912054 RepID=UPI0035B4D1B0
MPGPAPPGPALPGLALYAHLSAPIGLGSAGRGFAAAIAAAGLPATMVDLPWPASGSSRSPLPTASELGRPVALVATNPDVLRRCLGDGTYPGPSAGCRAYTIGYWSWEAPDGLPEAWRRMCPLFDEIWTPSAYGAACVAPFVDVPVLPLPPALAPTPAHADLDLERFGLPPGPFTFLSVFDARSNLDRKNPAGVIRAFLAAFPRPQPQVRLVLKTRGLLPRDRMALERLAPGRPDVHVLNGTMSDAEMAALVRACGCFVSLHRAEALGLAMAEAMAAGRPVIATAHSGNLDFMSPATAGLVAYDLVALAKDSPPFRRGVRWAEASITHAADLMRQVLAHPERVQARAARGARQVRELLAPEAVGARIAARLALLEAEGRIAAPAPARPAAAGRPDGPSILVATPVKNAARYLDRYFALLERLDLDPARLSIGLLDSDSTDDTWGRLQARRPMLEARFRRVTMVRHDFGYRLPPGPRYQASVQRERRATLARSRNRLLSAALRDEDWVLWIDADVCDYPPDLVERLVAAGHDVVVPHCVLPDGRTYDLNTFVLPAGADGAPLEDPRNLADGVCLPLHPVGRRHLGDFPADAGPVEVHGVGGTVLLVRGDLHRDGLVFPAAPYRGYLETEGLAALARDMGHICVGLPGLRVVHPAI